MVRREWATPSGNQRQSRSIELYARPADSFSGGGMTDCKVTPYGGGDTSQTLDANYYKGAGERTARKERYLQWKTKKAMLQKRS